MKTPFFPCIGLGFLLLLSSSCQSELKIQEITFTQAESYTVPLNYDQYWAPIEPQYIEENDTSYILTYDEYKKELKKYLYPTGELANIIPIRPFGNPRDDLWSYYYHNADSIFVMLNAAKHRKYHHDSTLLLLNKFGEVVRNFSLAKAPVWTSSQPNIPEEKVYYTIAFITQIHFDFPYLLFPMNRYGIAIGDTILDSDPAMTTGCLDVRDTTPNFSFIPVQLPSIATHYYPRSAKHTYLSGNHQGHSVHSFSHTDKISVYDLNSQSLQQFHAPSVISDTIYPVKLAPFLPMSQRPRTDKSQLAYRNIFFDSYRGLFIRKVAYPVQKLSKASAKTKRKYGIMVLDTNFQVIGEGIIPEGYSFQFVAPDGWYFWNFSKANETADSMHFMRFLWQVRESEEEDYRRRAITIAPQKKPGGWKAYLQEMNTDSTNPRAILFVPVSRGCEGCLDYMLDLFTELNANWNTTDVERIQCVVTGDTPTSIYRKLEAHQLTSSEKGLYIDQHQVYKNYVEDSFQQGRLLLQSGKSLTQITVTPSQLSTLKVLIRKHLNSEQY